MARGEGPAPRAPRYILCQKEAGGSFGPDWGGLIRLGPPICGFDAGAVVF